MDLGGEDAVGEREALEGLRRSVSVFQERPTIELQQIEDHVGNGDFPAEEEVGLATAKTLLEFKETERRAVFPSQDLTIEDGRGAGGGGGGDFGKGVGKCA